MTRFEERGVNRQYDAGSISEAQRALAKSCEICSTQGKYIRCSSCMIASVHQIVTETLTK